MSFVRNRDTDHTPALVERRDETDKGGEVEGRGSVGKNGGSC